MLYNYLRIVMLCSMHNRGRQALRQEQVEQIAAALGLPPHKLTDELLDKPSVLALIGGRCSLLLMNALLASLKGSS